MADQQMTVRIRKISPRFAVAGGVVSPPLKGGPHPHTHAAACRDLARRVSDLRPSHRDPEAFFVERDEIRAALSRLAREIR